MPGVVVDAGASCAPCSSGIPSGPGWLGAAVTVDVAGGTPPEVDELVVGGKLELEPELLLVPAGGERHRAERERGHG